MIWENISDFSIRKRRNCLPLVTRSFSSLSLRSSWCRSLFSLTIRAFSALYGSRRASTFRLSFSVLPADSLALRRLSVVWTRSLKYKRKIYFSYISLAATLKDASCGRAKCFTWIISPLVEVILFPVAVCSPADPDASANWRISFLRCSWRWHRSYYDNTNNTT